MSLTTKRNDVIAGYERDAATLFERYATLAFEDAHRPFLHLRPSPPADIVDIGAGAGRDAADLARAGHRVLAVEPCHGLRERAVAAWSDLPINWLDDALPDLRAVRATGRCFDLAIISAVWMHLSAEERRDGAVAVASLLKPAGELWLSLRHGPPPEGRFMWDVSAAETVGLYERAGLSLTLQETSESLQPENRRQGVTWTRLAFRRA